MGETKREILRLLTEFLEKYPEQRFTQALAVLDINRHIDLGKGNDIPIMFIEDNWEDKDSWILNRMNKKLKDYDNR